MRKSFEPIIKTPSLSSPQPIGFKEKDNGFRCYIREGENKGNSEYDFIEVINEKVDLLNSTMINITKEVKDKIESLDFTEGNIGMYFDENEKLRVSKEMHEKLFGK